MTDQQEQNPAPLIPRGLRAVFAERPVYAHENEQDYDMLLAEIIRTINPRDTTEFLKAKDLADSIWETLRLRELEKSAVEAELPGAADKLIGSKYATQAWDEHQIEANDARSNLGEIVRESVRKRGAKRPLRKILDWSGIDESEVFATAYRNALPFLEKLCAARDKSERRRDQALKSIEERRRTLAAHGRRLMNSAEAARDSAIIDVGGDGS